MYKYIFEYSFKNVNKLFQHIGTFANKIIYKNLRRFVLFLSLKRISIVRFILVLSRT